MIVNTKFKAGKYLVPVQLEYEDEYIFISFKYSKKLIEEIKLMEGAHWCGFDDKPRKIWRVNNSPHNAFQIAFLSGENPYASYDSDIIRHQYDRPLYAHQALGADFLLTRHYALLAAEMGCVAADTLVTTYKSYCTKPNVMPIREFYQEFHTLGINKYYDFNIKTLIGTAAKQVKVINVLDKGKRKTLKLYFKNSKYLEVTPDHEIGVRWDEFEKAENLRIGDIVRVCPNIISIGYDEITNITESESETFDIVCDEPYRHFLANNIHVHNCGKSLCAIEVMERSGFTDCWYVGPKSAIHAVELELMKWDSKINPTMMTYQRLVKIMKQWEEDNFVPPFIWFDESSRAKSPTAQRSQATLQIANKVRQTYGRKGFVILTSGSPAPKSPLDWWFQCRICQPGFLREGNYAKFRQTLAVIEKQENLYGQAYPQIVTWKDNPKKCDVCGKTEEEHKSLSSLNLESHAFQPSVDECSRLYKRMNGLVLVQFKKDCLDLPNKIYRRIELKQTKSIKDIAKSLVAGARTAVKSLILLRELSDGFQYIETETGEEVCPVCGGKKEIPNPMAHVDIPESSMPTDWDFEKGKQYGTVICDGCGGLGKRKTFSRIAEQVDCPKEEALIDLLDEYSEVGRVVIYAGFTGSVDRCVKICQDQKWEWIRVDGRGWHSSIENGKPLINFQEKLSEYPRIAFIGQPGAAGMGLTLTASPVIIYYSNDFNAESRIQSEDRCHRPGMDMNRGCTIIDLLHLKTDYLILENLKKKRELQAITLGEVKEVLDGPT